MHDGVRKRRTPDRGPLKEPDLGPFQQVFTRVRASAADGGKSDGLWSRLRQAVRWHLNSYDHQKPELNAELLPDAWTVFEDV